MTITMHLSDRECRIAAGIEVAYSLAQLRIVIKRQTDVGAIQRINDVMDSLERAQAALATENEP